MGLIRKALSVSTVGMIDFRSDKERVARSARLTKRYTKKQTKMLRDRLPELTPPEGMRAVSCARCNAVQNVPINDSTFECWQCKTTLYVLA